MECKDLRVFPSEKGALVQFITSDRKTAEKAYLEAQNGKEFEATIRRKRRKRSLDANAYLWVLCDKIAAALQSTKEEIYRELVRSVGVFTDIAVTNPAVESFVGCWESRGTGWIAEAEESTLLNCKRVRCYYGTSVYDTKEMARIIDEAVVQAKELGIETMTPDEIAELEQKWGKI